MTELERMVGRDERILWKGNPDKKCFILESIFNPLLPFALVWLLFDSLIIGKGFSSGGTEVKSFLVVFMLLHLMPVWIYIGGVIFSVRRHRHTQYIVTDRGIYLSGGLLSFTNRMKPFAELSNIEIHRGVLDRKLGVGDVVITASGGMTVSQTGMNIGSFNSSGAVGNLILKDLSDYQRVYDIIKQLQIDVYSDTMYPNDLRPGSNHGYRTSYHYEDDYRR